MQDRFVRTAPEAILLGPRHLNGDFRKYAVEFLSRLRQDKKSRSRGFTHRNLALSCIGSQRLVAGPVADMQTGDVETREIHEREDLAVLAVVCYLGCLAHSLTTCLGPLALMCSLRKTIKQQKAAVRNSRAGKAGRQGLTGSSRDWRGLQFLPSSEEYPWYPGYPSTQLRVGDPGEIGFKQPVELPGQIQAVVTPEPPAPAPEKEADVRNQLAVSPDCTKPNGQALAAPSPEPLALLLLLIFFLYFWS